MRGSVVKKGGSYYVKVELEPDPATGRRRQKWHSGYRTKREAERARVDLLSKLDRGEYVEPSHQSLGEFLEEWLCAIRGRRVTSRAAVFAPVRSRQGHVGPQTACPDVRADQGNQG